MLENWRCPACGALNPPRRNKCWSCGAEFSLQERSFPSAEGHSQKVSRYLSWAGLGLLALVCLSCWYAPHVWLPGFLKVFRPVLVPAVRILAPLFISPLPAPTPTATPAPLLAEIAVEAVFVYGTPGTDTAPLGTLEQGDIVTVFGSQSICEDGCINTWYNVRTDRFSEAVWIPAKVICATPCEAPPLEWGTYVVQSGDTLYSIARRHDADPEELGRVNCLIEYRIYVGQELHVPGVAAARSD